MSRKATRWASILTIPTRRFPSTIHCRHGSFHVKVESRARPLQPTEQDALLNRSTPELTSPIWTVPPFRFTRIELPVGTRRSQPFISFKVGKTPTIFHAFYEPAYKLGYIGNEILVNRDHPLHIKLRRKYEATEKDCLWWAAITTLKTSPKRFIRDETNRKLRAAFRAALVERGLDTRGRKVVDGKVESQGTLKGTINLVCKSEALRAKPEDMKKEALWTVDALVRLFDYQKDHSKPSERPRDPSKPRAKPRKIYIRNP
ncbi:hypothetical protein IWZ00DRAFT_504738 [Phyllosticta capitalensis]